MNPLLSISRARDLVKGKVGEPAMTITSVRPPFLALFALLVFLHKRLARYPLYATVPKTTTTTPVTILCLTTQSWMRSSRERARADTGAGGGGIGRICSGIHRADERVSRTTSAARSTWTST